MSSIRRPGIALVVLFGLFAALLLAIQARTAPTEASHYRANQINWHKTGDATAEFHVTSSWRCSFYFPDCTQVTPGTVFTANSVDFGDGSASSAEWEVISVDVTNDVVNAELHAEHTYATAGPFVVALSDCCRLSTPAHINNPDGNVRVETIVDLAATTASPVSSIPPIVDCALNAICKFSVPAFDPDGQSVAWRMSTAEEAGGFFQQPSGATIDESTGQYSWDTTGAALNAGGSSFYSTQVMVENRVAGNVVTKTPVDFFIRITDTPNQQPVFGPPTPDDDTTFDVDLGDAVTFGVSASDPDSGDSVTLGLVNKPSDATFTTAAANPATGTFSWTPSAVGTTLINLTAQDGTGFGASPRAIAIVVGNGGVGTVSNGPAVYSYVKAPKVDRPRGTSYRYQWYVDGVAIPKQTHSGFRVRPADLGKKLSTRVDTVKRGVVQTTFTSPESVPVQWNSWLTASVSGIRGGGGLTFRFRATYQKRSVPAHGTVTIKEGSAVIDSVSLLNGRATKTLTGLSKGRHTYTLVYQGDADTRTRTIIKTRNVR